MHDHDAGVIGCVGPRCIRASLWLFESGIGVVLIAAGFRLDLKHLKVVAFVQDEGTGAILQAVGVDVAGEFGTR